MNLIKYNNPCSRNPWSSESLFASPLRGLSMIEPLFERLLQTPHPSARSSVVFNESDDSYQLKIELPGFSKKDVEVEIDQNLLNLSLVLRGSEKEDGGVETKRSIQLPEGIDASKSSASLENGILTVSVPKKVARKPSQLKLS